MKQAVLPTGEVMHFPDETPDEHMHMQVRTRMGLPPPEPPVDPVAAAMSAVQESQQLSAHVAQSVVELHQQMGAVVGALNAAVAQIAHANQNMAGAVSESVQRMEAANAVLAKALTATKVVTKQSDGRFVLNVVK